MSDLAPAYEVSVQPFGKQDFEPLELGSRCLSFGFDDHANMAEELSLMLDNADLALWDDPRYRIGNRVQVRWGYRGRMTNHRTCVILQSRGGAQVQVKAHGLAVNMDHEPHPRVFEGMTRAAVVKKIAQEYGWGSAEFIEDSGVVYEQIVQPAISDAKFIRSLARKEGFEFFVQRGVLHFHRAKLAQQPKLELVYRGDGSGQILETPVIEEVRHRGKGAITAKGIDPVTKKPFEAKGSDADTKRDGLGKSIMLVDQRTQQVLGLSKELVSEETRPTSAPNAQAAKAQVDGAFNEASQKGIKMSCTIVGEPDLGARDLVKVSGIGRRFSGLWYVVQAKTVIRGSYTMALELSRNAHNGYGDQKRDPKSHAAQNEREPDKDKKPETYQIDQRSQTAIGWRNR